MNILEEEDILKEEPRIIFLLRGRINTLNVIFSRVDLISVSDAKWTPYQSFWSFVQRESACFGD